MFLNNRRALGLRARLLATSMFATGLMAGAGAVTLSPGAAVAAGVCTPTANGETGSGSATAATGTETCAANDTGIAYKATGGDLTVILSNGAAISSNGVYITDDGTPRNLTFDVDTTSVAGGAITATSSSESGIDVESNNGSSINIATGSATGKAGSVVTGGSYGIYAFTTGKGTINVQALNNVTGKGNSGIWAHTTGTGNVTVTAETNTGAVSRSTARRIPAGSWPAAWAARR